MWVHQVSLPLHPLEGHLSCFHLGALMQRLPWTWVSECLFDAIFNLGGVYPVVSTSFDSQFVLG